VAGLVVILGAPVSSAQFLDRFTDALWLGALCSVLTAVVALRLSPRRSSTPESGLSSPPGSAGPGMTGLTVIKH
jgi:hypothetical protein